MTKPADDAPLRKPSDDARLRKPPAAVAKNAEQGLKLREQFGRGGTDVGVRRAKQLSSRSEVPDGDIRKIASYFARHEVDKDATAHAWGDLSNPSAGFIAWQLWGGDEGRAWAEKALKELQRQS